ncbi:MAG: hypothetical protein OEY98_06295 [Acidimicrobiia bacterium]|nr:hypothetical protein [Acidimicrobiia bacterium]
MTRIRKSSLAVLAALLMVLVVAVGAPQLAQGADHLDAPELNSPGPGSLIGVTLNPPAVLLNRHPTCCSWPALDNPVRAFFGPHLSSSCV